MKRLRYIAIYLCVAAVFCAITGFCGSAYTQYDLSELGNCNEIFSDSNETGGYFYGFSNNTVYCARILPDVSFRYFTCDGAIRSISQSKNNTCVLSCINALKNKYTVSLMNNDTGSVASYEFDGKEIRTDSFSVTETCIFVLKTDDLYAYVRCIDVESGEYSDIKFEDNAVEIFNNNGTSYVRMYEGEIYRLSANGAELCATIDKFTDISNAGIDKIFTDAGCLVSLDDGSETFYIGAQRSKISESNGCVYYLDGTRLYRIFDESVSEFEVTSAALGTVGFEGQCGLLTEDFCGQICDENDFALPEEPAEATESTEPTEVSTSGTGKVTDNADSITPAEQYVTTASDATDDSYIYSDGIIKNISNADTIKYFKTVTQASVVYTGDGIEATGSKLKTGYQTVINSQRWLLAVRGDVTGEGNVNSRDVKQVMKHLCGSELLEGVYAAAADYNLDNNVDCRDLVLISRQ